MSILAVLAIGAVTTLGTHLATLLVVEPLAIDSPVVAAVAIPLYADNGRIAILAIDTILAIVNLDSTAVGKVDCVANNNAILVDSIYRGNIVVAVEGIQNRLQRVDVVVHAVAHLFKSCDAIFEIIDTMPQISVLQNGVAPHHK